jgi:hypothetical protein
MALFKISDSKGKAESLNPRDADLLERDVHELISRNIEIFFPGLAFIANKQYLEGKQLDTLAFHRDDKVPVIIEYKLDKDRHVLSQAAGYRQKLKRCGGDLVNLFRDKLGESFPEQMAFDQTEIYIVAKHFSRDQQDEIAEIAAPTPRLFSYIWYQQGIFSLEEITPNPSLSGTTKRERRDRGLTVDSYNIEQFGMDRTVRAIYQKLDDGIRSLDHRVKEGTVRKNFVGYRATGPYFCTIKPKQKFVNIQVRISGNFPEFRTIAATKIPDEQGTMTHKFKVERDDQIDDALSAVRIALENSL